jgi:hypothetical protein
MRRAPRCGLSAGRKRWLVCALLAAAPLGATATAADGGDIEPQLVNGVWESAEATTGALLQDLDEDLDPPTALVACSATLIGCDTAITTGHCFNSNAELRRTLFFQHAGFHEIESATRHPVYAAYYEQGIGEFYEVTRQEDIALIKLVEPVTGITPARINTIATPGPGTPGLVVGFGRDPTTEPSTFQRNAGIKRSGTTTLEACVDGTLSPWDVLCWSPTVLGDPGEDVTICNIDSGGPLFVDQAGEKVVAGLSKGGIGPMGACAFPVEAFDTNVFRHHAWIEQLADQLGAVDLSVENCGGGLPQVDTDAVPVTCDGLSWEPAEAPRVCGFSGELSTSQAQELHSFQVPADTQLLRVTLNGVSRPTNSVDVNLYVRAGAPPTTSVYDCAGAATGNFAACEFDAPQVGTWYVLAVRVVGPVLYDVSYQVTATEFGPSPPPAKVPALGGASRLLLSALLFAASLGGLRALAPGAARS